MKTLNDTHILGTREVVAARRSLATSTSLVPHLYVSPSTNRACCLRGKQ